MKTFIAGMFAGACIVGLSAHAGILNTWNGADTLTANALFAGRSGMSFTSSSSASSLDVHAKPFPRLTQSIAFLPPDPVIPPDPILPPDPVFTAQLIPPDPVRQGSTTLQIFHPEAVTILDASGNVAGLCATNYNPTE